MKNKPSKEKITSIKKNKPSEEKESPGWSDARFSGKALSCYEDFMLRYERFIEECFRTPLAILVWGPGPGGGQLYEKRLQIQDKLYRLGHVPLRSEAIDRECDHPELSAKDREMFQARAAQCIIVIEASPGAVAEVHDFADKMGDKMLVFIDEGYREGYSYRGALQNLMRRYTDCVETYSQSDIEECKLLEKVQEKVRKLQIAKYLS